MKSRKISNSIKFRCHSLGDLMTDPRAKKDLLSETTKSYLYKLYDEAEYGIKEHVFTKEIRKGLICEDDSIKLLNEVHGTSFKKNLAEKENDYIKGTCDLVSNGVIVDVKTSWDFDSFRRGTLTKHNYWQMIGYLWLWGLKRGYVAYCLVDTPEEFVSDALRQLSWQMGMIDDNHPEYVRIADQIRNNMTFSHINPGKRVKCFPVDLTDEVVESLVERIKHCKDFLDQIPIEEESYERIKFNGLAPAKTEYTLDEKVELIAKSVACAFGVSYEDILSKVRKQEVSMAKHKFRSVIVDLFPTLSEAARYINIHHATFMHSIKEHKTLLSYEDYKEKGAQADHKIKNRGCL